MIARFSYQIVLTYATWIIQYINIVMHKYMYYTSRNLGIIFCYFFFLCSQGKWKESSSAGFLFSNRRVNRLCMYNVSQNMADHRGKQRESNNRSTLFYTFIHAARTYELTMNIIWKEIRVDGKRNTCRGSVEWSQQKSKLKKGDIKWQETLSPPKCTIHPQNRQNLLPKIQFTSNIITSIS